MTNEVVTLLTSINNNLEVVKIVALICLGFCVGFVLCTPWPKR